MKGKGAIKESDPMATRIHSNTPEEVVRPKDRYLFAIDFSLPAREIGVSQNEDARGGCFNFDFHLPGCIGNDLNAISGSLLLSP